jgi:acetyl-CoA carboxylase carboxyl transferase subunit alpha
MHVQPLDFEKPILELQRRLQDLKNHSDEHEIDFETEVESMERKIRETRRDIYENLTAWQRVQIARHIQRPFSLDYIARCFTNWVELHGDRVFGDDKAMPCGLATIGQYRCVVITQQKGRDTKENVKRNFGCAYPEGYRKALRLMRIAEKFNLPGDLAHRHAWRVSGNRLGGAPHRGSDRGEPPRDDDAACADPDGGDRRGWIRRRARIGVADRVMILENAYYSVISPEACSAILWKDRRHAPEAASAQAHGG